MLCGVAHSRIARREQGSGETGGGMSWGVDLAPAWVGPCEPPSAARQELHCLGGTMAATGSSTASAVLWRLPEAPLPRWYYGGSCFVVDEWLIADLLREPDVPVRCLAPFQIPITPPCLIC